MPDVTTDRADLVRRAQALAARGGRVVLGIAGPPGAGKSTLAQQVVDALEGDAALVPMDGFHLHDSQLERLGRKDRKGAVDTFDAAGFVHLLQRLRSAGEEVVYAPLFVREQEHALAGALAVPRDVPLVVTEGNYLLADGGFAPVRDLLDASWFLDVDPVERRRRLVARHVAHGRAPDEARRWVMRTDEPNAVLVEATRERADVVARLR